VRFSTLDRDAIEKNVRYVDEDLNRCFSHEALTTPRTTLECARASKVCIVWCSVRSLLGDPIGSLATYVCGTSVLVCVY
jgi:hypothetical protein